MKKVIVTLLLGSCLAAGGVTPAFAKAPKALPTSRAGWNQAVTALERTKKNLMADKAPDVNGHKARALVYIQKAMQELRQVTQGNHH